MIAHLVICLKSRLRNAIHMLTSVLLPDLISLSAGSADFAQQSYS